MDQATMSITVLAERLAALEADRDELDLEISTLRGTLAQRMQPGDTARDRGGRPLYSLRPGKRTFKADRASVVLPEAIQVACMKQTLDGVAVKRLSPALWEQCCQTGEPYLAAVRT